MLDGVFALGDCANVGDKNMAATAQVAEQQGVYLADMCVLSDVMMMVVPLSSMLLLSADCC